MPNIITSDLEELLHFLLEQDILLSEKGYAYQADYELNSLSKLKEYVLKREAAQLEEADEKSDACERIKYLGWSQDPGPPNGG